MKVIKINLDTMSNIKIVPLADMHIGSPEANLNLIKDTIDYIKNNEDTYTIINGDIIDNTLKSSVGDVYQNVMSPMEQLSVAIDLLEPIKDKILVISQGNHERRTQKETDIDITYLIAKQLGIQDRYAEGFWYVFLRFGKKKQGSVRPMCYTITGYHGSGGGRAMGGKANRLADMSNIAIADLYITSHTHTPLSLKKGIYLPDYGNNVVILKELHYLMTNSFMDYGGYGETNGYHPTSNSICYAELDATKRKIKITI